ncbi:hypothetical protein BASA83_005507 [Batrachochytrium salamandrivorans]|nr:hypothetical protein BASA83_005507 [Batrachochytrium salamandrivorans]
MTISPTYGSAYSKASSEPVNDTARVMDRDWESIQKKTFTNWINSQLKKQEIPPIVSLDTDLSSGETLIQLLEIIGDESLGKYTKAPRLRLQKIENMNKALDFIKKRGVTLTNIGSEDIVDSNSKLILGLIWTIILRFSISQISEEGLTAKEGLLLWCQRRTTPYSADFHIKDFTFSWQDGLALCGLIHRHRPDLLNYWALDKKQKSANTQLAFDIAERHLGIPKLFAVEDIVDVIKPDERSVMTYVHNISMLFCSCCYYVRYALNSPYVNADLISKIQVLQQAWEMQNEYERRVSELLALLLGNIQTKLKTYNLKPYTPPAGFTLSDIDRHWKELVTAEATRKRAITHYIRESKDSLRQEYAQVANSFQDSLNEISHQLASLEGDLEQQLDTTKALLGNLKPVGESLAHIQLLNDALVEANIDDNEYTIYTVEDLSFDYGLLTQSLNKKHKFIENQIVARTKTNFTPQQLEEYSETFKHFDKDNSNSLKREEFQGALQSEGTAFKEDELEKPFWRYLRVLMKFPLSNLSITCILAGEKGFVTEADLYKGAISPAIVEYLKSSLARKEEGYDFTSFVSGAFGN